MFSKENLGRKAGAVVIATIAAVAVGEALDTNASVPTTCDDEKANCPPDATNVPKGTNVVTTEGTVPEVTDSVPVVTDSVPVEITTTSTIVVEVPTTSIEVPAETTTTQGTYVIVSAPPTMPPMTVVSTVPEAGSNTN